MSLSHLIAAAAIAVVLAFVLSPASARSCDDDNARCSLPAEPTAATTLRELLEDSKPAAVSNGKPAAVSNGATRARTVRHRDGVVKQTDAAPSAKKIAPTTEPATPIAERSEPAATVAAQSESTTPVTEPIQERPATDSVASFSQASELDTAAERVRVVDFNEINEIDLAAPSARAPAETIGQAVVAEQQALVAEQDDDSSWIGKLLLGMGALIFMTGAGLMLIEPPDGVLKRKPSRVAVS